MSARTAVCRSSCRFSIRFGNLEREEEVHYDTLPLKGSEKM